MILLKSIKLKNYCGYRDFSLDLSAGDSIRRWAIFYGPNGYGKSNFIRAVELLASPRKLLGRADNELFLRRLTYHPNYDPTYFACEKDPSKRINLYMEAVFATEEGDKKVVLENNWDDKIGLTTNELPRDLLSAAIFIDADSRVNMHAFQLRQECAEAFIDFAKVVYGFDCYLPDSSLVEETDTLTGKPINLYTDFMIVKFGNTLVHYKRFSDGEKKIATLLRNMFKYGYNNTTDNYNILLADNIEMHIYFKRHMPMMRKIEEHFPNTQIVCSTHSPVIVREMEPENLIDLEQCVF